MAKHKTSHHPDHQPPFIGQRHFNFWMAMLVGVFSIAAGYLLFTATRAAMPGGVQFQVLDINGQPLSGVTLSSFGYNKTALSCVNSPNYTSGTGTTDGNGNIVVNCVVENDKIGQFQVYGISLPNYQLCSCSKIQNNSLVSVVAGVTETAQVIMQHVAPPPPPPPPPPAPSPSPSPSPTPTPTPHPTPTPTPGSGGGSTKSSGSSSEGSTSSSSSSVPPSTGASSDTSAAPLTTLSDGTDTNDTVDSTGAAANVTQDQDASVTSDDHFLSVKFPSGTFDADATCQINKLGGEDVPVKTTKLLGPYLIDCSDTDGNTLTKLNHPVAVTFKLPQGAGSYAAYLKDGKWKSVKATTKSGELSFSMTALHLVAAAPNSTNWTPILLVIGALLLILIAAGLVVFLGLRRRGQQEAYDAYIKHRYFEGDAGARPPT